MTAMILFVIFYGLLGLALLVHYVLYSLFLTELGSRLGNRNSWLAWIPVVNLYALGACADRLEEKRGIFHKWRTLLLFLSIGVYAFLILGFAGIIAFLIYMVVIEGNLAPSFSDLAPILFFYLMYFFALLGASALQFLRVICAYKIFEELKPEKSIKYILLTLLVPFGDVYCLFRCKKMIPMPNFQAEPTFSDPAYGYDETAVRIENITNFEEQNHENHQQ
ncbi:MAG: hypothetical protein IJC26_03240 [Clostridia bacterium]|nr:hypothetical protein [Clostridia bacterium]